MKGAAPDATHWIPTRKVRASECTGRAASALSFEYSAALKASKIEWNDQTLKRMAHRPGSTVWAMIWAYRGDARPGDRDVLPTALQSLSELPPAVWSAGGGDQRQRQAAARIPLVCDALGDLAADAGRSALSAARYHHRRSATYGERGKRYPGRAEHAGGKTDAVPDVKATKKCMKEGCGKVENEKHVFHFPTCRLPILNNTKRRPGGGRFAPAFRLILRLENAGLRIISEETHVACGKSFLGWAT